MMRGVNVQGGGDVSGPGMRGCGGCMGCSLGEDLGWEVP